LLLSLLGDDPFSRFYGLLTAPLIGGNLTDSFFLDSGKRAVFAISIVRVLSLSSEKEGLDLIFYVAAR